MGGNGLGGGVQHSLLLGRFQLGRCEAVGLGIRLTWVLVSSLSFIGSEIVHSFKTGQTLGIQTTKPTSKI